MRSIGAGIGRFTLICQYVDVCGREEIFLFTSLPNACSIVHSMKVSEKSLELNLAAELLPLLRKRPGMRKAYLRGLTQEEENQEGVDFFVQLNPASRLFAFQFKAPRGKTESTPYRYTLLRYQHEPLVDLAKSPGNVFYVFPFYVTTTKLQKDVPKLANDTWIADLNSMPTASVFGSSYKSRTIKCKSGKAEINPEYELQRLSEVSGTESQGIAAPTFAQWYEQHLVFREKRGRPTNRSRGDDLHERLRRNPWLVRGLRVVIVPP